MCACGNDEKDVKRIVVVFLHVYVISKIHRALGFSIDGFCRPYGFCIVRFGLTFGISA